MSKDGVSFTMTMERETKGTYVYSAVKGSAVETLYVRKDALNGQGAPKELRVTLSPA